MAASGDRCDCGGRFHVASSRQSGERQIRFLKCDGCGKTDKEIVDAVRIWRRTNDSLRCA